MLDQETSLDFSPLLEKDTTLRKTNTSYIREVTQEYTLPKFLQQLLFIKDDETHSQIFYK